MRGNQVRSVVHAERQESCPALSIFVLNKTHSMLGAARIASTFRLIQLTLKKPMVERGGSAREGCLPIFVH